MSKDSKFTSENRVKKELVSLKGLARTEEGKLTTSGYFNFLKCDLDDYTDIQYTPEQARKIQTHLQKLSTGATAMTPMFCAGALCPFATRCPLVQMRDAEDPDDRGHPQHGKAPVGKQCHISSDKIWTTDGLVYINDLDPKIHTLVGYDFKRNAIRRGRKEDQKGFSFKKATRDFQGWIYNIGSDDNWYNVTDNHICIAKWNKHALNKFCVYLMKKGDFWRVGKSRILGFSSEKYSLPFAHRAYKEKADKLWILGTYDTNTEALLAEEYFSINFQTSKACFIESFQKIQSEQVKDGKHNGMYRWATTEQLEEHHKQFIKPFCFYAQKLSEIGLSIEYPIWEEDNSRKTRDDIKLYARSPMYIRACNIITDIMDIPVKPSEEILTRRGNKTYWLVDWKPCEASYFQYVGKVHSLDVERHKTYFAGNIAVHNCLIEVQLMKEWIIRYFKEYDVDPNNFTEVGYVNELADLMVLEMRLNMNLAKRENAELVTDQTVGVTSDGTPIIQKQISPFMEQKERLANRRSKIIKLMVGDRQEKYKKEAALKMKIDSDPSSQMATMRATLDSLSRGMEGIRDKIIAEEGQTTSTYSPQDIIDGLDD